MSNKLKISPFVSEIVQAEYSRMVTYAVHGFWSGNNVRVRQSRSYLNGKWEAPKIDWSCGGRDTSQESDDMAAECFAKAITDAVKVARKWQQEARSSKMASRSYHSV